MYSYKTVLRLVLSRKLVFHAIKTTHVLLSYFFVFQVLNDAMKSGPFLNMFVIGKTEAYYAKINALKEK